MQYTRALLAVLLATAVVGTANGTVSTVKGPRNVDVSILDVDPPAVADGKTLNTKSFEAAVKKVEEAGGGTVRVPKGKFLSAPFNFTSHMTLFLEEGAELMATQDPSLWPVVPPLPSYGRGRELPGPRLTSFLHGEHLEDVEITGNNGTINGQGDVWWDWYHKKELNHTRGRLVEFMYTDGITISNVTLRNSPFWTVHPYASKNIVVKHLTILNPLDSKNTDGVDPDSCDNVHIHDSYFECGDDGIAIKSGWDDAGIEFNKPSSNILIERLTVMSPTSAGVCIGSEMSGGVENVVVEDCDFINTGSGIRIKTALGRGAFVRNVTYDNIRIHKSKTAIMLNEFYGNHPGPTFNHSAIPTIDNINIYNVKGKDVKQAVDIEGLDERKMTNIVFHNIDIQAEKGFKCNDNFRGKAKNVQPTPCDGFDVEFDLSKPELVVTSAQF